VAARPLTLKIVEATALPIAEADGLEELGSAVLSSRSSGVWVMLQSSALLPVRLNRRHTFSVLGVFISDGS
jgi:hypothetical protein